MSNGLDRIYGFQDQLKTYFENEFLPNYTFDLWKQIFLLCNEKKINDVNKLLQKFIGDDFQFAFIEPNVTMTVDEWVPSLALHGYCTLGKLKIDIDVMLAKNTIHSASVSNMRNLVATAEKIDIVNEFEKNIILMRALKK